MMILNLSYKKNDHGYRVWHHHGRWRCWPIETGSYIPVARGNYTCMVDVNICIWISMYPYVIIISFKGDDPLFTSRWIVSTYENNLARLCNTKVLSCTQTLYWYYSSIPINCWKRSLCYKCYPCLFRLCSSSCSFKYEHYAYSVYRIFFIYTAPLIPQQMTLTFLQPSKKKKATVLFAEKEYMYMYVFSDTCKLIIL